MTTPSNFGFLARHSPLLAELGQTAEKLYPFDPSSCVLKLRLLAESLTQEMASRLDIRLIQPTQAELLRAVDNRLGLDQQVRQMFHLLRQRGNAAAHQVQHDIGYREGLEALKVAREVAVWFHRTFGSQPDFKPGPFVLPDDPSQKLVGLQQQIAQLQSALHKAETVQADQTQMQQLLQAQAEQERQMAQHAQEERNIYEGLAQEASERFASLKAEFDAKLAKAAAKPEATNTVKDLASKAANAAKMVAMDEATTRLIIDQMLIDAGWQADTVNLTHAKGVRPERNKNKAIAEWPTKGKQSADYMLFAGLTPIGAVEAKRMNVNVAGKIAQAERYARGLVVEESHQPAWTKQGLNGPWSDGEGGVFNVPFVYSCNGRPFVKQSPEVSGTWHRDVRSPANLHKPLMSFHSPDGLLDQLTRSKVEAEAKLKQEGFGYLHLRDYQQKAITAVEDALADGQQNCLLAMATGTGKTRTIIGLMYRFLKAERFRRILFLVDRTALGTQATEAFDEAPLEQNLPLSKAYNISEMGDMAAEAETRVQVATVQAMVKRIFSSDNPPPLDAYDCIIVDEAHRGYALDQEMTEGEVALRDQAQYLSSYRRVLEYFDAVKIGLTATPAKHTSEIFGKPVYTYSYREAVADDWLIDHEPPIRYQTLLTKNGIHFDKGGAVKRGLRRDSFQGHVEKPLKGKLPLSVQELWMSDGQRTVAFDDMSDGEVQLLLTLGAVRLFGDDETLFLFDEPETHLNPNWRTRFHIDFENANTPNGKAQALISSHSPFLVSSLPKEAVFHFQKNENSVTEMRHPGAETFGASFDVLIKKHFGLRATISETAVQEIRHKLADATQTTPQKVEWLESSLGESMERSYLINKLRAG